MGRVSAIWACSLVVLALWGCAAFMKGTGQGDRTSEPVQQQNAEPAGVCLIDPMCAVHASDLAVAQTDNPPVVQVPERVYDFGFIDGSKELVHTFVIRNSGRSELKIKDVLPG